MARVDNLSQSLKKVEGYELLPAEEKEIVDVHLGYNHEICTLVNIQMMLVDELRKKKFNKHSTRHVKCIRKLMDSLRNWQWPFMFELEILMYKKMPPKYHDIQQFNLVQIYNHNKPGKDVFFENHPFDKNAWRLSDRKDAWTKEDDLVIRRFACKLEKFFEEKIAILKTAHKNTRQCTFYANRLSKHMKLVNFK